MSTIYMIRHGQSEANKMRIWGGDFPLTDEGRAQALTVPERIPIIPQKVISSALKRANETAHLAYPEKDVEIDPAFNEIEFGTQALAPIQDDEYWQLYCTDLEKLQEIVKGDNLTERSFQAVEAMKKYAAEYETVAIFTSDTLLRNIVAFIQGLRPNETCHTYIQNCGIVRFSYDGEIHIEDISDIKVRPRMGIFA